MRPIVEAVKAAGGQAALGRIIGASKAQVNQWVHYNDPVPPARCPAIEAETGITCERLRPDVEWVRDKRGRVTAYLVRVG